jgi:predicted ATPase
MAPFITYVTLNPDVALNDSCFPGNLPFTKGLHLDFESPVTFFVGENGSGKSTLLEAIAVLAGFPIAGGGTNEIGERHGVQEQSVLADALRMAFVKRPTDGYLLSGRTTSSFCIPARSTEK